MSGTKGFSVSISAIDNATATIDKINKRIAALSAPGEKFNKAVAKLGDVSGVNRLAEGMQTLSSRTLDTFRSLDRVAPALAGITSAASIAGVAALVQRFGELGQNAANAGQRLGIPTDRLTALQGAARLAGSSAEDLTAGLGALDQSLRDSVFRGDAAKLQAFNAIGVSVGQVGVRARNAGDALLDVAEGVKRLYETQGRGAALRFMSVENLPEGLLPFLLMGKKRIADLSAESAKLGAVITPEQAQNAEKLRTSYTEVGMAAEGLGNTISEKLAGPVEKINGQIVKWIENNKDLIATDVAGWVTSFGDALKSIDEKKMAVLIGAALGYKIGGIKGALLGAGAGAAYGYSGQNFTDPKTGELPFQQTPPEEPYSIWKPWTWWHHTPGTGPTERPGHVSLPTTGAQLAEMQRGAAFWRSKGYTEDQVSGILANEAAESSFNATAWDGDQYGLYQYKAERLAALRKRFGTDTPTADQQRQFAYEELQGPESAANRALRAARTPQEAARAFTGFERPAGWHSFDDPGVHAAEREEAAPRVEQQISGSVDVHVKLSNAPPGTTATATGTGPVNVRPPSIGMAMPQ